MGTPNLETSSKFGWLKLSNFKSTTWLLVGIIIMVGIDSLEMKYYTDESALFSSEKIQAFTILKTVLNLLILVPLLQFLHFKIKNSFLKYLLFVGASGIACLLFEIALPSTRMEAANRTYYYCIKKPVGDSCEINLSYKPNGFDLFPASIQNDIKGRIEKK